MPGVLRRGSPSVIRCGSAAVRTVASGLRESCIYLASTRSGALLSIAQNGAYRHGMGESTQRVQVLVVTLLIGEKCADGTKRARRESSVDNARIRGRCDGGEREHRVGVWLVCLILHSDPGKTVDPASSKAVAGTFERQHVGVMDDPVDHRGGDGLIAEDST